MPYIYVSVTYVIEQRKVVHQRVARQNASNSKQERQRVNFTTMCYSARCYCLAVCGDMHLYTCYQLTQYAHFIRYLCSYKFLIMHHLYVDISYALCSVYCTDGTSLAQLLLACYHTNLNAPNCTAAIKSKCIAICTSSSNAASPYDC
eukprot:16475-Heterococcus_DN1.PRE.2